MALMDESLWRGKIFTGGWSGGGGGEAPVIEPATGAEIGRAGMAAPADVARAAQVAAAAQPGWAATPHTERSAILRRAAGLWLANAADIEWWGIRESGKIPPAMAFETHVATQEIYEAATLPSRPYGELLPSEQPRLSFATRVPAGVVGVIAPFNFPQILAIRSVAPALALGNAVILKPDPRTAVCGGVVLARVFEEAGLPPGLLHVLPGGVDTGEAVVAEPLVRIISFTGSTAAGRRVGELAARSLKRVHLELGGNSALIVLDDVDLPRAVSAGAWGSFLHQGQICMTTGRHLVHEAIYDEYVSALAEKAGHLPVGDPASAQVALGPIIDQRQRDKVHALVTDSVAAGAELAAGGTYDGLFYRPTVLAGVTPAMPAYASEVFGPVAPVVRFSTADDAAKLAAESEYGLSLGILTRDVMRGLDLAERIPTGIVHINEQTVDDEPNVPFGGLAASGTGARFGGTSNLEAFTETRWVTVRGDIAPYPF
ncbi:MAG: benzaldehyde dehydrogenase [Streptosporangiaceae bacterium]|nr:benzaldehyde dehydrogenase [Streptosporangiaceae bacterium]MBV9857752.1 benzaldehyde dehydrogenase [Streptosporangiaceae bacterium]